ncbi:helix-turn-helix domain-containing protein [Nocardia sp. XZ_19_385]|uniref:AlbA family DNA-binding domain-containing protein n=1 Tax=Nocardia sp. XZ_19_385 TaxID=2769488 RepID=UPI00188F28BA|nr:ATP-binding protein [Nocardia sp. XZ_19_385]
MTHTGSLWSPRTEVELSTALDNGLLEETHYLDLKRTLDPRKSANGKIACDIAAFALDGGIIVIGIDEDEQGALSLWPIELAGLPERIESIAATAVHEAVQVTTTRIDAARKPGFGYLIVHIPQSPRAPHMVDGRYYGRGDKKNRVLPQEEVLRLHQRRLGGRSDIIANTHRAIAELGPRKGRNSILAILAEPLGAPDDLLVPLTDPADWHEGVLQLVRSAAKPEHGGYSPTLADASGFGRRANAVALTTGMYNGRWQGEQKAAELSFHEDGSLLLASERAVETLTFTHVAPQPPPTEVIFETLIIGNTDLLVRVAAQVAERYGFTGTWRIGLVITGLRGAQSWTLANRDFGREGSIFTAETYERATEATLLDLTRDPRAVAESLVAPLLRSIAAHHAWRSYFNPDAADS